MLYIPSFRKNAFALTTVAALAGASVLASFSANAQQLANNAPDAACSRITNTAQQAQCRLDALDKHVKDTNRDTARINRETTVIRANGTAADARASTAQSSAACIEDIGKRVQAAKAAGPLTPEQKALFKVQVAACDKT
jgi:hypothetical protein